jgi:hypothetical protein
MSSAALPQNAVEESLAASLQRAEEAVAELAADYSNWALGDVKRAEEAFALVKSEPEKRAAHLETLYRATHDMKGQGGSFGYPLITKIGQSLCRYLHSGEIGEPHFPVIQAHIGALRLILEKSIKGDGGTMGDKLVAKLESLAGLAKQG